jgi:hypothetical protein
VPSPSAVFRYLAAFHDPQEEQKREVGWAFIPAPTQPLRALGRVNRASPSSRAKRLLGRPRWTWVPLLSRPQSRRAFSSQGSPAYQPLTAYGSEQDVVLHSEFRDGNVPAGYEQLRVFQEALDALPPGVEQVLLRADTVGYK